VRLGHGPQSFTGELKSLIEVLEAKNRGQAYVRMQVLLSDLHFECVSDWELNASRFRRPASSYHLRCPGSRSCAQVRQNRPSADALR
jgi:hypothetical protein